MSRRSRPRSTAGVPNLHFVMILVAAAIIIAFALAFFFAPADKSDFFKTGCLFVMAFLFGKFSNSFGKPFTPAGATVPSPEADAAAEEKQ